jgi:hypothetical protein
MARPQVACGVNGLQIWRVAANILNKQSWTADKGDLPAWGLGVGITHSKKSISLRNVLQGLRLGRILWMNDLS